MALRYGIAEGHSAAGRGTYKSGACLASSPDGGAHCQHGGHCCERQGVRGAARGQPSRGRSESRAIDQDLNQVLLGRADWTGARQEQAPSGGQRRKDGQTETLPSPAYGRYDGAANLKTTDSESCSRATLQWSW